MSHLRTHTCHKTECRAGESRGQAEDRPTHQHHTTNPGPSCLLEKNPSPWLTLVRQEVQHGLQQEAQVSHGQCRVPHSPGGIDELVKQAHLNSGPASVCACSEDTDIIKETCRVPRALAVYGKASASRIKGPWNMPSMATDPGEGL